MGFEDLKLSGKTLESIRELGYENPTEVQVKAIPKIIAGANIIVRSQTGTGKTAAFGIGLIERIASGATSRALVLTPTRELAIQVCEELRTLGRHHAFNVRSAYGGQKMMFQIRDLQKSYEILVATPGRLLDLVERRVVYLTKFNAVVLDEADHMLDIGFRKEVFSILDGLPRERLTLLFSATVDGEVRQIVSRYIPDPELMEVGEMSTVSSVTEDRMEVVHSEKLSRLLEVLAAHPGIKTLIFARTRRGVMRLKASLDKRVISGLGMLHGDMEQPKRTRMIEKFKRNEVSVLVATNVAARGLHIEDVGLIINYDEAEDRETHLHRSGRTGRMGAEGKVITFVSDEPPLRRKDDFSRGNRWRPSRGSRPAQEDIPIPDPRRRRFSSRGGPHRGSGDKMGRRKY